MTTEVPLQSAGPMTQIYESQLLSFLAEKQMNPRPGSIIPHFLRKAQFVEITRTQLILPIFWHDPDENKASIRNARTGEITKMTMSEVGSRISTLMYGLWEEIYGQWDDDFEDFTQRNRIRRKEAETMKTKGLIVKIGCRKQGKLA